nr:tartrate dehydrogenase [Betaproteobacteria bacterium]
MKTHKIAVIPGDGIGVEVMPEGVKALEAACKSFGIALSYELLELAGWPYSAQQGKMLPDDWKAQLAGVDAIFFGAVGW